MKIREIVNESGQSILDRAYDLARTAHMNYSDAENMLELERIIDKHELDKRELRVLRLELELARQRQSQEEPAMRIPPPPKFDDELEIDDFTSDLEIPPPPNW